MENEIEIKIMLIPENIPLIYQWLNQQNILCHETEELANCYYDTPDLYFAKEKMGLRVRSKNNQHEITLKAKGEITGGLHIRPEYNLALEHNFPDLKRLVSHYNLQLGDIKQLQQNLKATFSTDFQREKWVVAFNQSEIEIALDQGLIKNSQGEEQICELEFELKQGNINDILTLLEQLPKQNGIWFSSLSKAQRGYLVGYPNKIAKEIEKLTAYYVENHCEIETYQFAQQLADFIRLTASEPLIHQYQQLTGEKVDSVDYFTSQDYFAYNLATLTEMNINSND
ncbi:CYTH domain-containing protein [Ursidibacter maritimus]|uniref:CYTH domain-containing protein n=1 Tax=Ursidibacter maritimus TaxID=1331689 RepID=UPI001C46DC50|nr:CYTH domain-containing protein [Ursidibacter maritimus]MBV6541061.1 CYTH domain-containing protein [Ursidibacter maritimus]